MSDAWRSVPVGIVRETVAELVAMYNKGYDRAHIRMFDPQQPLADAPEELERYSVFITLGKGLLLCSPTLGVAMPTSDRGTLLELAADNSIQFRWDGRCPDKQCCYVLRLQLKDPRRCSYCNREGPFASMLAANRDEPRLRRCACDNVHYCNRECQRHDWRRHKQHCTAPRNNGY